VKSVVFDRLASAAGGNTMEIIAGAPRAAYLGHEIVTSQVLPIGTLATVYNGLLMLMFGDLRKAAVFGDRREITIALSTDVHFAEDEIAIKATERFDISVHDLGDGTTAGPLVALKGLT
jgi:HK97 family phage major capsid protein